MNVVKNKDSRMFAGLFFFFFLKSHFNALIFSCGFTKKKKVELGGKNKDSLEARNIN